MAKVQYPNPKFWKAKDNIDWKKQGENLKEVVGIFGELLKETDWQKFGKDMADVFKADGQRINTRGHGQHQLSTEPIGIKELFLFGTKGLTNHITTDT